MAIKHIVFDLGGVIVRINVPGYIKNLAGQSGFSSEKIKHLLRDNCDIIDQKPNLTEQYQVGSIDTETYFKQGAQLLDHKISPTQLRVFWQQVIVGEDEDVLNFIQTLQKKPYISAVTMGCAGSTIVTRDENIKVQAVDINPVDTNGAGDMFAGSFLYALLQNKDLKTCAKFANYGAAKIVETFGPRLTKENYQETLKNFKKKLANF